MKKLLFIVLFISAAAFARAGDLPLRITPDTTNLYPLGFGTIVPHAVTTCAHDKKRTVDWNSLSPADRQGRWNFKIMHKDRPSEIKDVLGLIEYSATINGQAYYYYSVPLENKGNLVRIAPEGVYMRNLKYPVFSFIFLDVVLEPEIEYLKFPMKMGDTWKENSTGHIDLLVFRINKDTTSTFTMAGEVDVPINGRMVHAYKTTNLIESGDRKPFVEEDWFAEGIGLMYQNTETYVLELQSYEPGPDFKEAFERNTVTVPVEKI